MKIFILFKVLLTFMTANAACLEFAQVDSFFESYGFNEDSRKVLRCIEKLKNPNEGLNQLNKFKTLFSKKRNVIPIKSSEITKECNRVCIWDKKVTANFRAIVRNNWVNRLAPDQKNIFSTCFDNPQITQTDTPGVR